MKIEKKKACQEKFKDLQIGDVFTDGHVYLMKTTECNIDKGVVNSVDLSDGEMLFTGTDMQVSIIPSAKVVIE